MAHITRPISCQAKNKQLEIDASEIRFRAEREIGELMQAQKEAGLINAGNPNLRNRSEADPLEKPPTLAEAGIDKHLAQVYRRC